MKKKITPKSACVCSSLPGPNIRSRRLVPTVCLLLMSMFVSVVSVFAQGRTVRGTVTEANGDGLPGVNIVVKGTTTGTVSDVSGKYSIEVNSANDVLVYSYVGYLTQ